jgi:hypothetical protein
LGFPFEVDRQLRHRGDDRAKGSAAVSLISTCILTLDPAEDIPNIDLKIITDAPHHLGKP